MNFLTCSIITAHNPKANPHKAIFSSCQQDRTKKEITHITSLASRNSTWKKTQKHWLLGSFEQNAVFLKWVQNTKCILTSCNGRHPHVLIEWVNPVSAKKTGTLVPYKVHIIYLLPIHLEHIDIENQCEASKDGKCSRHKASNDMETKMEVSKVLCQDVWMGSLATRRSWQPSLVLHPSSWENYNFAWGASSHCLPWPFPYAPGLSDNGHPHVPRREPRHII